ETPRMVAPVLPLRAVARRRRRRTGVAGSRILADQSLQRQRQQRRQLRRQQLGARMHTANALARKVEAEVHAQCIPPPATAPLTAARSKSSRSGSVGGVSSPLRTVHPLLASGPARRRPPTAGPRPGRRSWGINPPLESGRASTTTTALIPTTATAARSCT